MDRVAEVIEIFMCISFLPEYPISADVIEQMMRWKPNSNPLLGLGGGADEEWTRFLAHVTALRNTLTPPRLCEALSLALGEHYTLARRDLMGIGGMYWARDCSHHGGA
jgi:hypothetical protein